ncbi:MAG: DUF2461 domain-containing protein [Bacteroidota bacterium]|nr:DUF2461 domain-containing protein [Bacteroidota bacterium]
MGVQKALPFLRELNNNNNREWFHNNKTWYEEAKKEFEIFLDELIIETGKFDENIKYLNSKDCIFRIYKDIRFSKDKTPYKTNFGGYIVPGGKNSGRAGYYLHIQPDNSFIAGGIYMPAPEILKAVRQEIYYNISEFKEIMNNLVFKKYFNGIDGEVISRPPKDFPKEFPDIDLLKYKSYNVLCPLEDIEITSEGLFDYVIAAFKAMSPFNKFLNRSFA